MWLPIIAKENELMQALHRFSLFCLLLLGLVLLGGCKAKSHNPTAAMFSAPHSTISGWWSGFPVFPNAVASKESPETQVYVAHNARVLAVVDFYKQEMSSAGWELLGSGDTSLKGFGHAYTLWFSKEGDILGIEVFRKGNDVLISVRRYKSGRK